MPRRGSCPSEVRLKALFFLVAVQVGCSSTGPTPADSFYRGDLERALDLAAEKAQPRDEDYALHRNEEASVCLALGRWDRALSAILEANRVIESFGGAQGREVLAIVASESAKVFKGEPYERAMNAYYGGLLYLIRGDHDNGLAGFRNALFRDAASADPKYEGDFGPALYLLGREALRNGDIEEAHRYLDSLRARFPNNPYVAKPDPEANLLLFVDLGRGPEKVAAGLQGSKTEYRIEGGLVSGCDVRLGSTFLGRTARLESLYFQATTRGPREFDAILEGKAIAREASEKVGLGLLWAGATGHGSRDGRTLATLGGGLFLLSRLIQSDVDVRHWACLPREIHILEARVEPGRYEIEITGAGREVRAIEVRPEGQTVVYARPDLPRRKLPSPQPTSERKEP
ncbi:MAG: hypothetical protein AB1486_04760 [Planctomycetota bacterium]